MQYGVTANGFIQKMFSDIIASQEEKGKKYFGADWTLDQYTPEGALIYIYSFAKAEAWQALKQCYNANYLDLCTGIQLDYKGKEEGVPRSQGRYSNTKLKFTTEKELLIPQGTLVKKRGTDLLFSTNEGLTIGPNFTGEVLATSTDVGVDYNSAIGQIDELKNGIVGVLSVTNVDPSTGGEGIETDDRYRARIKIAKRSRGGSTIDTMTSELLKMPIVNNALVLENKGDVVDSNGVTPGYIKAFIDGTNDISIAQTIHRILAAGIGTEGDITYNVANTGGEDEEIKFSLMDKKQLYVKVVVNNISGTLTQELIDDIKTNIINYVEEIQTGTVEDRVGEIVINQLSSQAYNSSDNIKKVTTTAALTPNPTGTSDIPIPVGNYFYCDESTIEVVTP